MIQIMKELMPEGKPNYLGMVRFPQIRELIQQQGEAPILLLISIMLRDFCASLNVVRNMNEDQILEAAVMLLEEAGTFRLEDYATMFEMAKKGRLVEIRDRIDLQVITVIADEYFKRRRDAKYDMEQAELERAEVQMVIPKKWDTPQERQKNGDIDSKFTQVGGALNQLKNDLKRKFGE